ncbi:MAG: o-succinylbenzoate--CoA ligase [Arsenophonus sp. NC-TX2-MAG3]
MIFNEWPWIYWASKFPDDIALITENRRYSWRQLAIKINGVVGNLHYQLFAPQKMSVMLRGKNSPSILLCQLALLQLGARVLPINPQLPASTVEELIADLAIDCVIDFTNQPLFLSNIKLLDCYPVMVKSINYSDNITSAAPFMPFLPATLILTSGSIGLAKAVVHNITAHLNSAKGVLSLIPFERQDSWLLSLPLFHISGQGIIWRWLYRGARLGIKAILSLPQTLQGCSHASLVPTQLWRLLKIKNVEQKISLKNILLGGEMISEELVVAAKQRGISCWLGYGMTETASTICAKQADSSPGVGLPLINKSLCLVNNEIHIQADSLALGYWSHGEILPLTLINGWFASGDKGTFEGREWRILGRLDNQFFSGGEAIQPEDIELVLNSHPNIKQSFVIPIVDKEFGHRPVAVIDSNNQQLVTNLNQWLIHRLATFQLPIAYYLFPKMLMNNADMKFSRSDIKKWLLKHHNDNKLH